MFFSTATSNGESGWEWQSSVGTTKVCRICVFKYPPYTELNHQKDYKFYNPLCYPWSLARPTRFLSLQWLQKIRHLASGTCAETPLRTWIFWLQTPEFWLGQFLMNCSSCSEKKISETSDIAPRICFSFITCRTHSHLLISDLETRYNVFHVTNFYKMKIAFLIILFVYFLFRT